MKHKTSILHSAFMNIIKVTSMLVFVLQLWNHTATAKTVSYTAVNRIPITTANSNIEMYEYNETKNFKTKQFVFRADELKTYINSSGASIIQFILGEDTTVSLQDRKLSLYPVMIDTDGNHIYLKDGGNMCYVLGDTTKLASMADTLPKTPYNKVNMQSVNAVTVVDADFMISTYQNNGNIAKSLNTYFMYNAKELIRYLNAAIGIKYVEVFIGQTGTTLELILVGHDNTTPMYFRFNGASNVMNSSSPCPNCVISSFLENCQ